MKCSVCGKSIGNWPTWLEDTRIGVRCEKCAGAPVATLNAPQEQGAAPLSDMAARYTELAKAA